MKRFLIFLGLIVICVVPLATVFAADVDSESNQGSSPASECDGYDEFRKFDQNFAFDEDSSPAPENNVSINFSNTTQFSFDWTASPGIILKVVVKAGTVDYGHSYPGGSGGASEATDGQHAISHITFCWNDDEPEDVEATATVTSCEDPNATTSTPAYVSVSHATMHISGDGGLYSHSITNISDILIGLTPGVYAITYSNPDPGYTIPAGLPAGFTVEPCASKEDAEASAEVQKCEEGDVTQPVILSVTDAKMHVTGNGEDEWLDNETKTFFDWPAGTYTIAYVPDEGFNPPEGPLEFTIGVCETEDAQAKADPQACRVGDEAEPVFLSVDGATMNVSGPGGYSLSLHNESGLIDGLAVGVYTLEYVLDNGFVNPGLPTSFTIYPCEKGDEFYDLSLYVKCVYDPSNVIHKWTVTNMNAFPVDFTWTTGATSGSYAENGAGTVAALGTSTFTTKYVAQSMKLAYSDGENTREVSLTDGICEEDEEPDEPAGGLGPSAFSLIAPALIGISGTTLTWILLKRKTKKAK